MAPKKKKRSPKAKTTKTKSRARSPRRVKKKAGKIESARQSLSARLDRVNRVINRFEGEVEGLLKKLVKQGERSRNDLIKNFDDIVKKIRKGKIIARANQTREELEKEVRRVAEEVIGTIKDVETILKREKVSGIFENARTRVGDLVEIFAENGLVIQAKHTADQARKEFLGLFSIPTQGDVEKLEKKIVTLEKRLNHLSRKAA
jgi:archaellum component FlaC